MRLQHLIVVALHLLFLHCPAPRAPALAVKSVSHGFLRTHGARTSTPTSQQMLSLQLITTEQNSLLQRLAALKSALTKISSRAKVALETAGNASASVTHLAYEVGEQETKAVENNGTKFEFEKNSNTLNQSLKLFSQNLVALNTKVAFVVGGGRVNSEYLGQSYVRTSPEQMKQNAEDLDTMVSEDLRTMKMALPRLQEINQRLTKLRSKLHGGNITDVVNEAVHHEMSNVMEDIGRSAVQELDRLPEFGK